jgi:nucleotide-binding universal stress UspA family protein
MIDRILVPLDGSRVAEQILPHLRRLLFRHDSEVILVRAAVPPPIENGILIADSMLSVARDYLLQLQDRMERQGVRVRTVARIGDAVGVIMDAVEEEKATMVALATHGETGLKRLLAGSVAEAVLKQSPVPVMVVRPFWSYELLPARIDGDDLKPMRNILVPVDETDDAEILLPSVTELARLFQARVILLHVLEFHKGEDPVARRLQDEDHLARFAARLESQVLPFVSVIGKGEPARAILEASRTYEVDLIAMTTHGKSRFLRFFSSTVTVKVLHESSCPILVVRSSMPDSDLKEADPAGVTGK